MEYTTTRACKFILTTYDDGKNNKFYDSTFRIRPPFAPNSNGQYKITINECLFNNNEPTLIKDEDYFEIEIDYNGAIRTERFKVIKDIITNSNRDDIKIIKLLHFTESTSASNGISYSGSIFIKEIKIYDENDTEYNESSPYIKNSLKMDIMFKDSYDFSNINSVKMRYSTNFGYLFNKLSEIRNKIEIKWRWERR